MGLHEQFQYGCQEILTFLVLVSVLLPLLQYGDNQIQRLTSVCIYIQTAHIVWAICVSLCTCVHMCIQYKCVWRLRVEVECLPPLFSTVSFEASALTEGGAHEFD